MTQLIPTQSNDNGDLLVSGRDLHEFLESNERYSKWFDRMKSYGFMEDIDFTSGQKSTLVNNGAVRELEDHLLTVDTAKEISMLQRNEKGKQARQYFLELERRWNSPDAVIKRAHEFLQRRVDNLTTENLLLNQRVNELQPKATYYDLILQNKSLLSVTKIAKDYGWGAPTMNKKLYELGVQYKQGDIWLLYAKHQDKGYTQTHTHIVDSGDSKISTKWTQKGRLFIYELLKRNGILPMIEREKGA